MIDVQHLRTLASNAMDSLNYPPTRDRQRMLAEGLQVVLDALAESEQAYASCAHAIGVEYTPDMGPSWPGPVADVVRAIEEARRDAGVAVDLRVTLSELEMFCPNCGRETGS